MTKNVGSKELKKSHLRLMMLETVPNQSLTCIPKVSMEVDDTSDLAYKVKKPLPAKSFALYITGQPGSGKTSALLGMLLSRPSKKSPDKPRFYYRYFDHIYLISNSLQTLPLDKLMLCPERVHNEFCDTTLQSIIETEREGPNLNNCLIIDDCIRDITNSKEMAKLILARRHATQNPCEEGQAGMAVMITSQVYNWLPLGLRKNMSHLMIFRTENQRELNSIKKEVMADLSDVQADNVMKTAWSKPHSFLFIDASKPTKDRYYACFDKIIVS